MDPLITPRKDMQNHRVWGICQAKLLIREIILKYTTQMIFSKSECFTHSGCNVQILPDRERINPDSCERAISQETKLSQYNVESF